MEILLRHFNTGDCDCLSRNIFPNTTYDEIIAMISEWDTLKYNGLYFEMFAIEVNLELAGYASLYGIAEDAVSVGLSIIPEHQRKGIGHQVIMEVMYYAKKLGYKKATARVLTDNLPSLKLCEKSGFSIINNDITSAGKAVYCLEKTL